MLDPEAAVCVPSSVGVPELDTSDKVTDTPGTTALDGSVARTCTGNAIG